MGFKIKLEKVLKWNLLFNLVFFVFYSTYGIDFQKVDAYSRAVSKSNDYKVMAKNLTTPFKTQQEKVRAIFIWITDNISYDFDKYFIDKANGGYTRIYGTSMKEIEIKRQKLKQEKILKTYQTGKGVCEDYSFLFEAMCQSVSIEAKTIVGFARFNPADIGRMSKNINHAWNSVKIDGKWYLLDATWAAGTTDFRTGIFTKKFQEGFYLTDPEIFILNHFPEESKFQYLDKPLSFESFSNYPFIHDGYYDYEALSFSPYNAFINSLQNIYEIRIEFENKVPDIIVMENENPIKYESQTINNSITLKISGHRKPNNNIIIGVKNGKYFDPIIEYKLR